MTSVRLGDLDLAALYAALDEQRRDRGLTWAGATREINRPDARPVLHPISPGRQGGLYRVATIPWPDMTGMSGQNPVYEPGPGKGTGTPDDVTAAVTRVRRPG